MGESAGGTRPPSPGRGMGLQTPAASPRAWRSCFAWGRLSRGDRTLSLHVSTNREEDAVFKETARPARGTSLPRAGAAGELGQCVPLARPGPQHCPPRPPQHGGDTPHPPGLLWARSTSPERGAAGACCRTGRCGGGGRGGGCGGAGGCLHKRSLLLAPVPRGQRPQDRAGPRGDAALAPLGAARAAVPPARQGTLSQAAQGDTTASGRAAVMGSALQLRPRPRGPGIRGPSQGRARTPGVTCSEAAFGCKKLKAGLARGGEGPGSLFCVTEVSCLHTGCRGLMGVHRRPGAGDPDVLSCGGRNRGGVRSARSRPDTVSQVIG